MNHAVALFPEIADAWVHDLRAQHDPLATAIAPHVTLVFPTSRLSLAELEAEVPRQLAGARPFRIALRSAMVMPNALAAYEQAHVFLVPDEGYGSVLRMHQRLYAGALATDLRADIPFVPHLTVGAGLTLEKAHAVVAELNARDFCVEAHVDTVTLIACTTPVRTRVRDLSL